MTRAILVIQDYSEVRGLFGKIEREIDITREEAMEVAKYAIRLTRERTSRGVDIRHRPFAPYAPGYAAFRERKGRPSEPPDLLLKGEMLGALRPTATRMYGFATAKIYMNRPKAKMKAAVHQAGTLRVPQREFLGFVRGTPSYSSLAAFVRGLVVDKVKDIVRENRRNRSRSRRT